LHFIYGGNNLIKKSLAVGIVFLFIVSSTIPMVLGNDVESEIQTQAISLSDGPMDSSWPAYSHDNCHTGQSPYNTRDNPMDVKWRFEANYLGFPSSPVIDKNGVLYIGARDHYLVRSILVPWMIICMQLIQMVR